jgi:hypothetical protein
MSFEPVICAVCGREIENEDLVVLEDADGEGRWIVVAVGLRPGSSISGYLIFVHASCLRERGRFTGVTLPGRG